MNATQTPSPLLSSVLSSLPCLFSSQKVILTDDLVFEYPDETINVRLLAPGIEPTFGGALWSVLTVTDDGDGGMGTRSYYDRVVAPTKAYDNFGESVSVSLNTMVVGAPRHRRTGTTMPHGAAFVYVRTSGVWGEPIILEPPKVDTDANTVEGQFGAAVDIYCQTVGNSTNVTVLVGAPGLRAAYVYSYVGGEHPHSLAAATAPEWALRSKLERNHTEVDDRFGGLNAVALWGDVAVIGAPGIETVWVFQRPAYDHRGGWVFFQRLMTKDYHDVSIRQIQYVLVLSYVGVVSYTVLGLLLYEEQLFCVQGGACALCLNACG